MSFQVDPPSSPIVAQRRTEAGPLWNTAAAAVVAVLVVAYIAAAIVQILILREGAADAAALGAATSGSDSLTTLETLQETIRSHVAAMRTANQLYQVSFWAMFIAFFGWQAILRSRLRAIGRTFDRRSMTAWKVWRVGMLVSIAMIFVAQSGGTLDSPEAIVSEYHQLMAYYAVRAAVGLLYLWVVYSVWRSAGPEFAAAPPTAGYAPGFPPSPTSYHPSSAPGYGPAASWDQPSPWEAPAPRSPYPVAGEADGGAAPR